MSQHIGTCSHGIPGKACKACCGTWISHAFLQGFIESFSKHPVEEPQPLGTHFEHPIENLTPNEFQEWYAKYWPLTM